MSDVQSVVEAARLIRSNGQIQTPGVDDRPAYRLDQVLEVLTPIANNVPMLRITSGDSFRDMRFMGDIWDYDIGDTVVWTSRNGAPLVLGRVSMVGSPHYDQSGYEPWNEVGAAGQPAFANSWVNYGSGYATAAFFKQTDGWVWLKGTIKNGSAIGATMFTLPEGYRPPRIYYFTVATTTGYAVIRVNTVGTVSCVWGGSTTDISLNGIFFPTETNPGHWILGEWANFWVMDQTVADTDPLVYIRDDGLCVWAGILETGTATTGIITLPDRARIGRQMQVVGVAGGTVNVRLDVGGPSAWSHMQQTTAEASVIYVGGIKYFGQSAVGNFWNSFPFATGWDDFDTTGSLAVYQTLQYRKDHHGIVWLRGLTARSGGTATVGTLPVGYRPSATILLHALGNANPGTNNVLRAEITSAGVVTSIGVNTGGWFTPMTFGFRAEQ